MNKNFKKIMELLKKEPFFLTDNISCETEIKSIPSWDSLKHLIFLMEFEKKFKVDINPEEITKLKTINDLLQKIEKR